MLIALLDNDRVAPSPNLKGAICPCCGGEVIARCGPERVHHFAHKVKAVCDSWKEPETEWHRSWKGLFPEDWREVIGHDAATGEKHIADVRTPHGLTIEFQHSSLHHEERIAREAFHGNMLWMVDGTRLVKDVPRFLEARTYFREVWKLGVFLCPFPEEAFHKQWLNCGVPVFFDFRSKLNEEGHAPIRDLLWCLIPYRVGGRAVVVALDTAVFVDFATKRSELLPWLQIAEGVADWLTPKPQPRTRMSSKTMLAMGTMLNQMERRAGARPWQPRRKTRRF